MSEQSDLTNALLRERGVLPPEASTPPTHPPIFDPLSVCKGLDLWWCGSKYYWREGETFREVGQQEISRLLRVQGYSRREIDDSTTGRKLASQIDQILDAAVRYRAVDQAGSVAGLQAGIHEFKTGRFLCMASPVLIEPVSGECPVIMEFLRVLLGEEGSLMVRLWLKFGFEALRSGNRRQGQCLVLCGPSGKGKSVLQARIITAILAGRSANPKQWLLDKESFNADLIAAEHLMVEEMPASVRYDDRVALAERIKEFCVNQATRLRDMHKRGITVYPHHRLSLSLNDEPERLKGFPPLTSDFTDKLLLLRTSSENYMARYDTVENGFQVFLNQIDGEMPAFAHHLLELEVPDNLKDRRYGVRSYVDSEIAEMLYQQESESVLLVLIDDVLFGKASIDFKEDGSGEFNPWTGSATDLKEKLTDSSCKGHSTARKILDGHASQCGLLLGKLEKKFPDRFSHRRTSHARIWTILPPPVI